MAKTYHVLSNGSQALPVADGTLSTQALNSPDMSTDFDDGVFVISFYDANGDLVTPTAGSIVVEMSPVEGQWLAPSGGDATIQATEVIAGSATYTAPRFTGPAIAGRLTFAGVTGATTARAYFWRTRNNNNQ
ncbi:hypothetical protein PODOV084v1_p0002 [Vibrio phage 340E47.2]|nr:hypothetical protein PODOV084v1_p0002 [Vibrio phage 340E47.2]QZI91960.1 hypothetical protein PODOV077v1_p0049 [Vibrio phage 5P1a]